MKKIVVFILITFSAIIFLTGCGKSSRLVSLENEVNDLKKRVETLEKEKRKEDLGLGYEDIEKISISKFSYTSEKSFKSRNCIGISDSYEMDYIKNLIKIFDSKVLVADKIELTPMDYQVNIFKKSGKREAYEVSYDKDKAILISEKGAKYIVDSQQGAKELKYLIEDYWKKEK